VPGPASALARILPFRVGDKTRTIIACRERPFPTLYRKLLVLVLNIEHAGLDWTRPNSYL
jgi:hypothetical protein